MARGIFICHVLLVCLFSLGSCSRLYNEDYLQAAKEADKPNKNFLFATNASIPGRIWMTFSGKEYKTCINTVTSFYNKYHTCSNCEDFIENPAKWSFVKTDNPQVGDMIVQHDPQTGRAHHAVIIVDIKDGEYIVNHAVLSNYYKNVQLKNKSRLTFYRFVPKHRSNP